MTFRLFVTGDRNHTDRNLIWWTLDEILAERPGLLVVHGACYPEDAHDPHIPATLCVYESHLTVPEVSVDWIAHLWCVVNGLPDEPHPAQWDVHQRAAGPIRNAEIVQTGIDACVAFPLPSSRGTWDAVRKARKAGIEPRVVTR
jgi:hypothetical protein